MTSSSAHAVPAPVAVVPRPLWSRALTARPRGVTVAREKATVLVWDESNTLHLFDRNGQLQGQVRGGGFVTAAATDDVGAALAAVGSAGEVWWLAPDLSLRWQKAVPHPAVACALDPFGKYLAVADAQGGLHLFDRTGKRTAHAQAQRALHHLAFVPERPLLVGAADVGLVAAFAPDGQLVWRAGLVASLGALAVTGDGGRVVLACFTDGLRYFNGRGEAAGSTNLGEPCPRVAVSYDGRRTLAANLGNRLLLLDETNRPRRAFALECAAAALAVDALGDTAVLALGRGQVLAIDLNTTP